MRVRIEPASPTPASEQLRDSIASEISRGRLVPGARLPPVRVLAAEIGLAPNTVAKAYRSLEAGGLLVARGRRGTFVVERLPERPTDAERRLREAARRYTQRARQLRMTPAEAVRELRRELGGE